MRKVLIGRAHPSSEIRTDAEDEYLEDDEIDTHVACNAIESGDEFREGTDEAAGNNDADDDEFLDKMTERQSNKKRLTLKPTKPRAKLDYTRIMGENGFPLLLKRHAQLKLSLQKGSQEKNLNTLLSFYKDWAHGLFPKFPFHDVVKTIEKQCHKKEFHFHIEKWFRDWKAGVPMADLANNLSASSNTAFDFSTEAPTDMANGPSILDSTDQSPLLYTSPGI